MQWKLRTLSPEVQDPMERGYHVTDEFLTFACLEYTDKDCPERYAQSQAMLDKQPEHIGQDIYTASIIGDTNTVRDLLQQDSSLVEQKGGPRKDRKSVV